MFTTMSRSGNSKRCGVLASRSFGPISGSVLMIVNTLSMTSTNSSGDLKFDTFRKLYERAAALDQVLVDLVLDRLAYLLGELEHERAVVGGLGTVAGQVHWLAKVDSPPGRQGHDAEGAERREGRRDGE